MDVSMKTVIPPVEDVPRNAMKIDRSVKEVIMGKVFVGDIHARPSLVISAIEMANGRDIIFLGDIFDGEGGAQGSKDCLDIIRASGAEMILGNHELYPLFFGDSQEELAKAWGIHYDLSQDDQGRIWREWQELRALLTEDDMAWLRSRPLWVKGKTWTAVHAKLPDGKLPPRFVKGKPTASQIELLDNTNPDNFWARNYKGSHGLAIIGHTRRSKIPQGQCSWDHVRLIDWDAKKGGPGCVYFLEEDKMSEILNHEPTPPPPLESAMAFEIALSYFIALLAHDVKIAALCGVSDAGNPYYTERPMKNKKSRPTKDIVMRSKFPRPHKDPAMRQSRMSRRQKRRLLHLWRKRAGIRFHGVSVPRPEVQYIYTESYKVGGGRKSGHVGGWSIGLIGQRQKEKATGPANNRPGTALRKLLAKKAARANRYVRPVTAVKIEVVQRKAKAKRNELSTLRAAAKPFVAKPVVKSAAKPKVVRFDDYLDATRLVKAAFGPRSANTGVKTLDKAVRTARRALANFSAAWRKARALDAMAFTWAEENPAQVANQSLAAKAARLQAEAEVKSAQAAALAKVEAEKKAVKAKVASIRVAIASRKAQELSEARAAKSAKAATRKAKAAKAKAKVKAMIKGKAGIATITTVAPTAKPAAAKVMVVMTKPEVKADVKPAVKAAAKPAASAPAKPRLGTGCSFVSMPHNLRKEIAVVKFTMPAAPVREHAQVTMEALKALVKFGKTVPVVKAPVVPAVVIVSAEEQAAINLVEALFGQNFSALENEVREVNQ
jgi:hypothetical protein